ncbi:MAG TPA: hypothetical protein VEU96_07810 [Bryobacteraceae bacterium]|nr:hypothetical protein [Bryobacteraceae bacterium]
MRHTALLVVLAGVPVLAQLSTPGVAPATEPVQDSALDVSHQYSRSAAFHLDREPLPGGAELVTLFGRLQDPATGAESLYVPLISVLRDTLGDGSNADDRLRYVWILTSTRPTLVQRFASALSFVRFRTGSEPHANRVPSAVLDLAAPGKTVWSNLLGHGLQSTQLDPLGMTVRTATRSYRGNFSDYRKVQIFQALGAMEALERSGNDPVWLPEADLRQVYSRLSLSNHTFGGLVRDEKLARYYDKEATRLQQAHGHNWELLRQRAELAGLYFEPLALPDATPSEALLWVAREDLGSRPARRFDRQFLNIANPWTDERLRNWTGYTQVRFLDAENRIVAEDAPGARPVEMIPLALYSLDYPRVPLLLADFRDTFKPKRGELARHGASTLLTGVFGITRFGNWTFFAADTAWTFVRGRHGAAEDRSARLRAYSEAREFLALDTMLDPELKTEMLRRVDHLALNPLENGISTEATVAKEQYAALLQYAQSPRFTARLERDRRKELASYTQSRAARMLSSFGHLFTGTPHPDTEKPADFLAELTARRSLAYHQRFLQQLLASGPRPDVVGNASDILNSVEALASDPRGGLRASRLISEVFARSADSEVRYACLRALQRSNAIEARQELWRLSQDPATGDGWRVICMFYFKGENPTPPAASPGGTP